MSEQTKEYVNAVTKITLSFGVVLIGIGITKIAFGGITAIGAVVDATGQLK